VSDTARNPDNYCYRHPDRESYIVCQRCGRTICPECQTQAAVGVHCPECVREARANEPKRSAPSRFARAVRSGSASGRPVVTYAIVAITVVIYLVQLVSRDAITPYLTYYPVLTRLAPWTMITALFVHGGFFHVALNMYSVYAIGPMVEQLVGKWRYLALYLLSGFGGSVAVLLLSPQSGVLGASGAIFGLLGALFVIQRRLGGNSAQLLILIVLNLAAGFFLSGVSWQAHVGGLAIGALVALIFVQTRRASQSKRQVALLVLVFVVLAGITAFASLS
jgi:membrane associated rhomboid family serine protease